MPNRKTRRKKWNPRFFAAGVEQSITRARTASFEVVEIQVSYDGYKLLCKFYGDDMLEEVLGVPLVIEDQPTPYEFGMTTNTLRELGITEEEDMVKHMRSHVERRGR